MAFTELDQKSIKKSTNVSPRQKPAKPQFIPPKKWEFDIMDLHGLKSCEVEIADHIKFKAQSNPDIKNLLNLAWGIYVRNAPVFLTVPLPDGFKEKEILIHRKGDKILIT